MVKLLHEALADFSHRTPDQPALIEATQTLSYADLYAAASRLAHDLTEQGKIGQRIGICARRPSDRVLAMYAIMMSGNAWVPIDPDYPEERIALILQDADIDTVLVSPGQVETGLSRAVETQVVLWRMSPVPAAALNHRCTADSLAYVIYTSGSTGRPKGVMVPHGAVATTVQGMADVFGLTSADRMLQFASLGFDASIAEIGVAICSGASLVLADRRVLTPSEDMAAFLRQMGVTSAILPPSTLAAMPTAATPAGSLPNLINLICAGEAFPVSLAREWAPGRQLFNAYGPTEAAICATATRISDADLQLDALPIGKALPGVGVSIVGPGLQQVGPGETGELLITGQGVANGYVGLPDLTQSKFVDWKGERAYRSGDLVRATQRGIVFCGREDDQVKISGFRVEPGEISDRLRAHEQVKDACVAVLDDKLCAWVVCKDGMEATLREWCSATLPRHTVPATFVVMDDLPRTIAGKVDKSALPAPQSSMIQKAEFYGTQAVLANLFAELLQTRAFGPDDSFFELGGTSLVIGRLAAQIRQCMGAEVPLSVLFERSSIADIADYIDQRTSLQAEDGVPPAPPPLVAGPQGEPAPVSFPQERIWFVDKLTAQDGLAYQAQASIRLRGPLDAEALRGALTKLVARHESLRTSFVERDGKVRQEPGPAFDVEMPVVDLSDLTPAAAEEELNNLIAKEIRTRFDVAAPSLARWVLYRMSSEDHALLQMEHHLIHDGWSFSVLAEEMCELYEAQLMGRESALAPPDFQFADFARWQRNWLHGDPLERFVSHWKQELDGAPPALFLPTDRPRPPVFTFRGDAVKVKFDASEYEALRLGAREMGVTLYAVMLSAFSALLGRYSEQRDFVVGAGVANRRLAEAERIAGMAINTLPLRMKLANKSGLAALARQTQSTAARGFTWGDVPLDHLVEAIAPARDPSINPIFSVIFSFHDAQVPVLEFGGLKGEVTVQHNGSAKSDINIVVIPEMEQRVGQRELRDETLTLVWEYSTDLFTRDTAEAMVRDYRALIAAALQDPQADLWSLPLAGSDGQSATDLVAPAPCETVEVDGFRVNMTEVAGFLSRAPGVADAAVAAVPVEGAPRPFLVAYVVPMPGQTLNADRLQKTMAERFSRMQAPKHVLCVEALSRRADGQLDTAARTGCNQGPVL